MILGDLQFTITDISPPGFPWLVMGLMVAVFSLQATVLALASWRKYRRTVALTAVGMLIITLAAAAMCRNAPRPWDEQPGRSLRGLSAFEGPLIPTDFWTCDVWTGGDRTGEEQTSVVLTSDGSTGGDLNAELAEFEAILEGDTVRPSADTPRCRTDRPAATASTE